MSKTTLLAGTVIALFTASSAAFAADVALKATAAPTPPPMQNWNGFYIGANLGGAWASGTLTDSVTGANFTGNHSGVIGGGTVGYNWQFVPNWVVGFEGTFDGTSISKSNSTINGTYITLPVSISGSIETNWIATAAVRLGYAQGNWLFYGKGGAGWVDNSASLAAAAFRNGVGWIGGTVNASNNNAGWLAGGGVEYGLTQHWTIKAEYDYLGLSNWTAATPFVRGDSINVSRNINMFTLGVNYRFY